MEAKLKFDLNLKNNKMKKLIMILSVVMLSLTLQAQVADCSITARYVSFYEWNNNTEEFISNGGEFVKTYMTIREDYYKVKMREDESRILYWEFYEKTEDGDWVYRTEDGRKVLISSVNGNYIWFFYEYNDALGRYTKYVLLSKITVD